MRHGSPQVSVPGIVECDTSQRRWQYWPEGGARPPAERVGTIAFSRRLARALVLGLFLLSFGGSWAGMLMRAPEPVACGLVAAGMAVPLACLFTILCPTSWFWLFVYRALGGGNAVLLFVMLAVTRPAFEEIMETTGLLLYAAALLLATVVEFVPARQTPRRDYAGVFR